MQRVPQWYGYQGRTSGHYSCCPMLGASQSLACENQEEGCCVENVLGVGSGGEWDEGMSFRSSKEKKITVLFGKNEEGDGSL